MLAGGFMTHERETGRPRPWSQRQSRVFFQAMRAVAVHVFFPLWLRGYRVLGAEHVPSSGGCFVIANHSSGIDPVVLGAAVPNRMSLGPGKIELFANPAATLILRKIGIFPLRQGQADASAVRTMVDNYRRGRVVIVYPEGGRADSGVMQGFNPDFARLMIKLKAPVIPAGIAGARELLPIGSSRPRFGGAVVIAFGECVDLSPYYARHPSQEQVEAASALLFERVAALVAQARRERESILRG